ncbi:MAG: FAD-dependent oxidoreductase [Clostridia bacterium]|nr:FAD-dependent oxidoreductase [Clostridia bacterium]
MESIREEAKVVPVKGNYDVIVAGGGIAGIASALASKRQGAKTLLIEKAFMLGGLATAGLVTIYLPLCDGEGTQVSYGIAEELLRLSVKHGYEARNIDFWLNDKDVEKRKKTRFETQFNANVFAILCEQLLRNEGVDILYGTSVCAVAKSGNRVDAVITENKSGREAYVANAFIDATGDADLFKQASSPTVDFGQGNVAAYWYYEYFENAYKLRMLGFSDTPDKYKTKEKIENDTRKRYTGLDGKELSELTCYSHSQILDDFLKKGGVNDAHAICSIATTPQIRMTRRIDGKYVMCDEEIRVKYDDSVGLFSDWRKKGPVYELPFRCLYSDIDNMFTCGRSISVTDDMWDITRVIPVCAVSGEAVGIAAAMLKDRIENLDVTELQAKLRANGVKIHTDEL